MMIGRGLCVAVGVLVLSPLASGQYKSPSTEQKMGMEPKMTTTAEKIKNATSAAPASISLKATIKDWPASEGAEPVVLRKGSNGWTCFPDMPHTKGNDPMCLDQAWMGWLDGYLNHKDPQITHVGIGYMIAPGGAWTSNTDPYATKETPDNQWGYDPPHIMIVVPNVDALNGLPTDRMGGGPGVIHPWEAEGETVKTEGDRTGGGPWVMYPGTPYAHLMVPVSGPPTGPRATR